MTVCDAPAQLAARTVPRVVPRALPQRLGFTCAADGSYAACLVRGPDGAWIPERWTLDSPEPYTVRLPGRAPERPGSPLLPLPDGRVLICRRGERGFRPTLLYPTREAPRGPRAGTAELPLGQLQVDDVRLVPLPPGHRWPWGAVALALGCARGVTTVWLVSTEGRGPRRVAELAGRHLGGVWLDREGRMLALDALSGGRVKTVALDLDSGRASTLL
jgi:hypothetical protein